MAELFHSASLVLLDNIIAQRPHAVILTGPNGIGLSGVVTYLSAQLGIQPYTVLPEKNEKIDIEAGVISVDSIRRLYDVTKTIERKGRLVVIDYAERMGVQAQNAFLKLLEEPGEGTMFVLLTHEPGRLLPTIRSRARSIELREITLAQSEALLDELKITDARKRSQLLFIAKGLPAELKRLAQDDAYFEQRAGIVRDARTFLQGSRYDKLKLIHAYRDDRPKALLMLKDTMNLLEQAAAQSPKAELFEQISTLVDVYERVEANGNIRLQLAKSVV